MHKWPPANYAVGVVAESSMLKLAANLTRDLNSPSSSIYWADMLGSAVLGYIALYFVLNANSAIPGIAAGLVAVLALYRAGSFIHELTHIKPNAVPGFRLAWNLVVGIPLLVPSFLYEGVHNQHHAKTYYGTVERSRISAAGADEAVDLAGVPGRRGACADRQC